MCDCHVPQDRYGCKEIERRKLLPPGRAPVLECFYLHLFLILKTGLSVEMIFILQERKLKLRKDQ